MALIEPHHIKCVSFDNSILIARFGDWACVSRIDMPTSRQKWTCFPLTKVSWLFDELSDNNASDDGLSLSAIVTINEQILEVIFMVGNNTMLRHTKLMPVIILIDVSAHSTI